MCDCAQKMNSLLEKHGAELDIAVVITQSMGLQTRFRVATKRIDSTKRKPIPPVVANYCPFCGENSRKPELDPQP